jgi:hypothetical protein
MNTSQVYTIATNEGLRRAMESLTRGRGATATGVPHKRRTAAGGDSRKCLKLLVAGGRLELPTLGL